MPVSTLQHEPDDEPEPDDVGRAAATASQAAQQSAGDSVRAYIHYDYEKAEDNEIDLVEGEYVTNIDMVDEDWWMGENSRGQVGLFPSNYVEVVQDGGEPAAAEPAAAYEEPAAEEQQQAGESTRTATALYDYEAGEDNELSFPEGAKITDVDFPDEDWWSGVYNGHEGLFPANYVELDA